MKKLSWVLIGLVIVSFFIVRCGKESSTPKNAITYENQTYNIDKGILENYGKIHGTGNNLDLTFLSSSLVIHEVNGLIDSISGTGNGVNFEMYTNSTTALAVGDYTFDKDSTGNPGTFDYGNFILNYNTATNQGTLEDIGGGIITVKSAGATYEITFNCTTKSGKGVTGYFKGPLKYYDNTAATSQTKSATIKSRWWRR
jgi:hypothetical protein